MIRRQIQYRPIFSNRSVKDPLRMHLLPLHKINITIVLLFDCVEVKMKQMNCNNDYLQIMKLAHNTYHKACLRTRQHH